MAFSDDNFANAKEAAKAINAAGLLNKKDNIKTVGLSEVEIIRAIFVAFEILEAEDKQDDLPEEIFDWYTVAVEEYNKMEEADEEPEVEAEAEVEEEPEPEVEEKPKTTRRRTKPVTKVEVVEEEDDEEPEVEEKPKTSLRRTKPVTKPKVEVVEEPEVEVETEEEPEVEAEVEEKPKTTRRRKPEVSVRRKPKVEVVEEDEESEVEEVPEVEEKPKTTRRLIKPVSKPSSKVVEKDTEEDVEEDAVEPEPPKKPRVLPRPTSKKELKQNIEEAQEDVSADEVDDAVVEVNAPPRPKKKSPNGKGGDEGVFSKVLVNMVKYAMKGQEIGHEEMAELVKAEELYVRELRRKAILVMKHMVNNEMTLEEMEEVIGNEPVAGTHMGRPLKD